MIADPLLRPGQASCSYDTSKTSLMISVDQRGEEGRKEREHPRVGWPACRAIASTSAHDIDLLFKEQNKMMPAYVFVEK